MIAFSCFECSKPATHAHHVVPKSLGGTRTVGLCLSCHSKVHDRDFIKHRTLQLLGIAEAKKAGVYRGRKPGTTKAKPAEAIKLRDKGNSVEQIAKSLGVSRNTVFVYLRGKQ